MAEITHLMINSMAELKISESENISELENSNNVENVESVESIPEKEFINVDELFMRKLEDFNIPKDVTTINSFIDWILRSRPDLFKNICEYVVEFIRQINEEVQSIGLEIWSRSFELIGQFDEFNDEVKANPDFVPSKIQILIDYLDSNDLTISEIAHCLISMELFVRFHFNRDLGLKELSNVFQKLVDEYKTFILERLRQDQRFRLCHVMKAANNDLNYESKKSFGVVTSNYYYKRIKIICVYYRTNSDRSVSYKICGDRMIQGNNKIKIKMLCRDVANSYNEMRNRVSDYVSNNNFIDSNCKISYYRDKY
jgi:hypothetical protein